MITPFKSTDKILVLDFDHTCYDTDAFLLYELRQAMLKKFDIPIKAWEDSYESAVKMGYSLERHRSELIKILKYEPFSVEDIRSFEKEVDFSNYLYKDVIPVLDRAKALGYKMMLLSFGDPVWQSKKVTGVGFDKIMDVIKYTKEEGNKMEVLKKYVNGCKKIIFIENNGRDIDEVHRSLPYVETYFMNRVPVDLMNVDNDFVKVRYGESRRMAKKQVVFNHKSCSSFNDVVL